MHIMITNGLHGSIVSNYYKMIKQCSQISRVSAYNMHILSPIRTAKFLSPYQIRADFSRYGIALKALRIHCTGIYSDTKLPWKSANIVAAMCRIHHRVAVYPLSWGHGVIINSIQCKHGINL